MSVKNLSVKKGVEAKENTYTLTLEKSEIKKLKGLMKKANLLSESISSDISIPEVSDKLTFLVTYNDDIVLGIASCDPDGMDDLDLNSYIECFTILEIKKKKGPLSGCDEILVDLFEYSHDGVPLFIGNNPISREIMSRLKKVLSFSKELKEFFLSVEKRLSKTSEDNDGLTNAIYHNLEYMGPSLFENFLHQLLDGCTMEITDSH